MARHRRTGAWTVAALVLAGAVSVISLAHARAADSKAIHGPVMISLTPTGASFVWESHHDGDGKIVYADHSAPEAEPVTVASTQLKVPVKGALGSTGLICFHRVTLAGLKPATAYTYHVTAGEDRKGDFTFTTPEAEPKEIVFAAYGDSRGGPEVHRRLVTIMKRRGVQFLVHTGDLARSGKEPHDWETDFADSLEGLCDHVPIYAAFGNHDHGKFYEPWCLPLGGKFDFGFQWGNAHFACFDNINSGATVPAAVEKDLAGCQAEWKFVYYHIPTIDFGGHESSWGFPEAVKTWDRLGVDFVLEGHSHLYERIRPVRLTADSPRVTEYITTGGGGAHLKDVGHTRCLAATASEHHVCIFTITGRKLTMEALNTEGKVIDKLTVDKDDAKSQAALLEQAVLLSDLEAEIK